MTVDDLFFDGAVEAFDHAVGFGLADEGEARGEAMKAALSLEVVGEILAAMVMPELDATGGISTCLLYTSDAADE